MPIGFSQSTGLPVSIASRTFFRCEQLGVATKTASTSGERQRAAAESKAWGILYSAAEVSACFKSRRNNAVTRLLRVRNRAATGAPHVARKPTMPYRIINRVGHVSFVA